MNKTEYLLTCLTEECAEIQQATTKALRFGLNDDYKEITPSDAIVLECNDLLAVVELLVEEGAIKDIGQREAINKKKEKLLKFMEYSRERNLLT